MTRQTGGIASAEISTRSSLDSSAILSASSIETMPICSPSAPINRTSRAEIFSLIGAFGAARLSCLISRLIMITPHLGAHAGKPPAREIQRIERRASSPDQHLHGYARRQFASLPPDLL